MCLLVVSRTNYNCDCKKDQTVGQKKEKGYDSLSFCSHNMILYVFLLTMKLFVTDIFYGLYHMTVRLLNCPLLFVTM